MENSKMYLGDGVYAVYDGCRVTLLANDFQNPSDKIYLEPEVLEALNNFVSTQKMFREAQAAYEEEEW